MMKKLIILLFTVFLSVGCGKKDSNNTQSVEKTRLAADQGYAMAQVNLGLMYYNGRGVPQDYAQAMKWFRLAADQGYAMAQYNLGTMYAKGQGVPQDDAQAVKWYRLAADQGDAETQEAIEPRATERRAKFPGYWTIIGLLAALLVSRLFRTRYKPEKEKE